MGNAEQEAWIGEDPRVKGGTSQLRIRLTIIFESA